MKFLVFQIFISLMISLTCLGVAQANSVCKSVFLGQRLDPSSEKLKDLETETQNGKPRYFTVRNYSQFKDHELDTFIKSIKNLTQFSEKLSEIGTFMPDRSRIPSEAFFVANQIIPLIESFLNSHNVDFRIETYENDGVRRSLIVIAENGPSRLSELSSILSLRGKVALVVDPVELFYGFDHYMQSHGKFFDIDAHTPAYSMSFYLLLHSVRKDFSTGSIAKTDAELQKELIEMQIETIERPKAEVKAPEVRDPFVEHRAKVAAQINEMIEKARIKKGSR